MASNDTTSKWMFYHDGVYGPAEEQDLRDFGERLGIHSDANGMASVVMEQMWDEIDRLREELRVLRKEQTS